MRSPVRLKNLRPRLLPIWALWIGALLLSQPTPVGAPVGGGLVLVGGLLRTWGAGHLVKNKRLTVTGPYAHLRHPLYAGSLLLGVGTAIIVGGAWALVLLAVLLPWFFASYFPHKERSEGAKLEARYGAAYADYRAAVPALLPRLRAWVPRTETGASAPGERGHWSGRCYVDNNELGTALGLVAGLSAFAVRATLPL